MPADRDARVRDLAHSLWEAEGSPEGRALHHWLKAESETGSADAPLGDIAAHPDDVDRAAGPSHGDKDFGGHDAEAEGAAAAGVGGQHFEAGTAPTQAGTDEPKVGEDRVQAGQPKRVRES